MQHSWQQKGTAGHKVLLRTMWDMWYLKLSLIYDCVRVKEWVAEGSDAGGLGQAKYLYRGCGLSRSPQFRAVFQKNWGLGMTTIGTTATCVCAVIKKDESDYIEMGLNLLFKGTVLFLFSYSLSTWKQQKLKLIWTWNKWQASSPWSKQSQMTHQICQIILYTKLGLKVRV